MIKIVNNVVVIGVNSKYSHSSLALRYFRENCGCDIFECSINDDIFDVYTRICEMKYKIFCFSVYIWNIEFILKLVPMLKNARKEIKIIFGGPEAGYNYTQLLNMYDFIDGIIVGEGEYAIAQIVKGYDQEEISNYAYRNEDKIICNKIKKINLESIKFPYNKSDMEELKNKIIYFESSRGCCFNCSYCLSSSEGKTRYFDIEYVKKGIQFFIDNNVELVKFVDRTFNEDNERACEILKYIVENNENTKFHFEVSPILLTEEFKKFLGKASGLVQLEMGIQTTNKETMKCIKRVYDPQRVKDNLCMLPDDVHIHLDLIAGLPKETLETFKKGFNYVYYLQPGMLQLGFLKLLHNTNLKKEAEKYGIVTTMFSPYEVISTNTMSAEDLMLLKKVEKAVDKYYNSGAFENTVLKLISCLKLEPFDTFEKIGLALYECEKQGPLSRTAHYELLLIMFGDAIKSELVRDFVFNNPNLKIPDKFLTEDDKNCDLKYYRQKILEFDEYKNVKFRLVAAGGTVFIISDKSKVDTYTEFCLRHIK